MKIKNTEIKVIQGDLTECKVEAIVNVVNNELVIIGTVSPPVKFIIHATTDEDRIRLSCRKALKVAEELKINSIVFSAFGCGTGGFPLLASAKIMGQEVFRHLRQGKSQLKEVIFCLNNDEAYKIFQKGVEGYLDYMVNVLNIRPYTTVDALIEVEGGIVLIERSNPPFGWALPGGFVDYGESLEGAVRREAKEETSLDLENLKQFHTYSDPERDPRFHTIGTVFTATSKGKPKAGDDAAALKVFKPEEIKKLKLAFDHSKILEDYFSSRDIS